MEKLLNSLKLSFPALEFTAGSTFAWSPETNEVFYRVGNQEKHYVWSLLHETGHGVLQHNTYKTDVELLKMEVAAWDKAKELAPQFNIAIDEDHIQDCLDTYRDWLHARSICPTCTTKCLQQNDRHHYRCHNCHTVWKVTPSRFCRAYRSVKNTVQPATILLAEN